MKRHLILATALSSMLAAGPALAQSAPPAQTPPPAAAPAQQPPAQQMAAASGIGELAAQLETQGYTEIEIRRTLLGRYRVQAENSVHVREIVMHQRTGEILRDVVLMVKGTAENAVSTATGAASSVSGPSVSAGVSAGVEVETGTGSVGGSVETGLGLGN